MKRLRLQDPSESIRNADAAGLARLLAISDSGDDLWGAAGSGLSGGVRDGDEPFEEDEASAPTVAGYRVLGLLGRGGMGTVWRAVQEPTGRTVALKLIGRHTLGIAAARARFEREVELLSRLEHPHIARLYDTGLGVGRCFYAMELIEGDHLDVHLQRLRPPQERVLRLMSQVCQAVDYAHQQGVLHRDLKPSNILIDREGQPRLVDFGLARSFDVNLSQTVSLEGTVAGTLAYMAPEQAAGRQDEVGVRADVYSLGVILYELLTGQLPHDPSGPPFEAQRRRIEEPPRRPRDASKAVDAELEAILLKALATDPAERYPTAAALAVDLVCYLEGRPIRARPLTAGYACRKWLHRRWRGLAAATMMLTLAGVGSGVAHHYRAAEGSRLKGMVQTAQQVLYADRLAAARAELENSRPGAALALLQECPADLRGWEWRHLHLAADASLLQVSTAPMRLRALSASPDGQRIVGLDLYGRPWVWGAEDGRLLRGAEGTGERVAPVALSAGGAVAAVARGRRIEIRDVETWQVRLVLEHERADVYRLALGPQGETVAAVAEGNHLTVWDATHGGVLLQRSLGAFCQTLALGQGGRVAYTTDATVCLARLTEAEAPPQVLAGHQGRINSLAFSPSGRWLATGGAAGVVKVWDTRAGEAVADVDHGPGTVFAMAFDPGEGRLVTAGDKGTLRAWDWRQAQMVAQLHGHDFPVTHVMFTGEGHIVSASEDRTWRKWDPTSPPHRRYGLGEHWQGNPVSSIAFLPGHRLHLGSWSGKSAEINALSGEVVVHPAAPTPVAAAGIHPASFRLDGAEVGVGEELAFAATSPDGRWLVAQGKKGPRRLTVWDLASGDEVADLPCLPPAAFSGQGNRLIARSDNPSRTAMVWDVATWQPVAELPCPRTWELALDGTGACAAVTTQDGELEIWDVGSAARRFVARPYGNRQVADLAFSPDGRRLATAGPSVKLFDPRSGAEVFEFRAPLDHAYTVRFDPTGRWLAVGAAGEILLWQAK